MILLRRLGGPVFALNADLIERVEATPDTVITLVAGNKYVVSESLDDVMRLIMEYRAQILILADNMSSDDGLRGEAPGSNPARGQGRTTGTAPVTALRRADS